MKQIIVFIITVCASISVWGQKQTIADLEKDFYNRFIASASNEVICKSTIPTDEDYLAVLKQDWIEVVKTANEQGITMSGYCNTAYKKTYSCSIEIDESPIIKQIFRDGAQLYTVVIFDDEDGVWGLASYAIINGKWKYFCMPFITNLFEQ